MKLSAMLQKHLESENPQGLSCNFGDAYLLKNNLVYKNIRRKTLSSGFSFSDSPDADYLAFPMGQLENVLSRKVIPYTDNFSAVKTLSAKAGNLDWDHVVDNLKPNYIFHESCHAIARTESKEVLGKDATLQTRLTTLLIEESFANACEFFAIADAGDQFSRNFLQINSYFTVFDDRTHLRKTIEKVGAADVFKVMLLGYLHSNFLNEKMTDADFKRILDLTAFKKMEAAPTLKSLAKNCFALNPRFRYTTTEMYLRVNNVAAAVEEALDFDYLQLVKNNSQIMKFINSLSQIAGDENER